MRGGWAELEKLLGHAGLEILEPKRVLDVPPPASAWRLAASAQAVPVVALPEGRLDLVQEANAQWHTLAVENRVIDQDGVFLIDIDSPVKVNRPRRWTKVRLTANWDLIGVLADQLGRVEFVTVSPDGDALLQVTAAENTVRL